jgi:hypothetical protein
LNTQNIKSNIITNMFKPIKNRCLGQKGVWAELGKTEIMNEIHKIIIFGLI